MHPHTCQLSFTDVFTMQRLGINQEVWGKIESKNVKKKMLKAFRKGDDVELARRAAFLHHVLQGAWTLPPDLSCLLGPSHDLYVPRANAWGRAPPPSPNVTRSTSIPNFPQSLSVGSGHRANEYEYDYEIDYSNEYASDAEEEWNLIA